MDELLFKVTHEESGYVAVAVDASIATQGDTWDELCSMVLDAVKGYFHNSAPPARIRIVLHMEEVLFSSQDRFARKEKPDLKAFLLGGPKFDDFEIERELDYGREIDL